MDTLARQARTDSASPSARATAAAPRGALTDSARVASASPRLVAQRAFIQAVTGSARQAAQRRAIQNQRTATSAPAVIQCLKTWSEFKLDDSVYAQLKELVDAFHDLAAELGTGNLDSDQCERLEDALIKIRRVAEELDNDKVLPLINDVCMELAHLDQHQQLRGAAKPSPGTVLPESQDVDPRAQDISDLSIWEPRSPNVRDDDKDAIGTLTQFLIEHLQAEPLLAEDGIHGLLQMGCLPSDPGEVLRLLLAPIRLCQRVALIARTGIKSHAQLAREAKEAKEGHEGKQAEEHTEDTEDATDTGIQASSDRSKGSKTHFLDIQRGRNLDTESPWKPPPCPETLSKPGFSSASVASERQDDTQDTGGWAVRLALDGHKDARLAIRAFQQRLGDDSELPAFLQRLREGKELLAQLGTHIRNAPMDSPEKRFLRLLLSGRSHYTAMFASTGKPLKGSKIAREGLIGKQGFTPDVRELTSESALEPEALTHLILPAHMSMFDRYLSKQFEGKIMYVPTTSVPMFTYFDAQIQGTVRAGRVMVPDYDQAIDVLAKGGESVLTHITRGPPR